VGGRGRRAPTFPICEAPERLSIIEEREARGSKEPIKRTGGTDWSGRAEGRAAKRREIEREDVFLSRSRSISPVASFPARAGDLDWLRRL
jgi:hypothetical protein